VFRSTTELGRSTCVRMDIPVRAALAHCNGSPNRSRNSVVQPHAEPPPPAC
jgi:hypothetical protein